MPYDLKFGHGRGVGSLGAPSNGTAFLVSGPYSSDFSPGGTVLTQVHCHTTSSDGSYSPGTVVAYYLAAGYGALAITDHDMVTSQPAGITTAITANELSPSQQHIISLNASYTRGATTDAQTLIDAAVAAGGQVEIAHPKWTAGMTYDEMYALSSHMGFEVFNAKVLGGAGQDPTLYPGYAIDRWDQLLAAGKTQWGFAVDDLHGIDSVLTYDMGRLKVFAASNTVSDVMSALGSGQFVADVSNHGVTVAYPTRSAVDISLSLTGATRIEAWGASGLLSATSSSSHTHTFSRSDGYVRLVAIGDYTEGFGSSLSDRWQAQDGTWTVSGGVLSVSTADATPGRLYLRRPRQGDFTCQVDMNLSAGGSDQAAIIFNALNTNYHFIARIGESGVSGWNNVLGVGRTTTGGFSSPPSASFAFDPTSGTWYTMKLAFTASTGRIRAKVFERGGAEPDWQVDYTDTTWTSGMFGLRANRTCQFDNFYVDGFETFYQPVTITAV